MILLHGFPFDHSLWDAVRRHLPATIHPLTPDLPGFGAEPALAEQSMEHLADWLAHWLTRQGIERTTLVGHSMGGYVALAFAARYPSRLAGLGLLHSTAAPDTPEKQQSRNEQIAFVERNGSAKLVPTLIRPLVAPGNATRLQPQLDAFVGKAEQLAAATLQSTIAGLRDRADYRPLLGALRVPLLLLSGRQDPTLNLDSIRQQATEASNAIGVFLDDCGHLGMLEQPAAVAAALTHLAAVNAA